MPKTPSGKQPNTLFSYFKKTPKSESKSTNGDILSPRKSPNTKSSPDKNGKRSPKDDASSTEWKVGDVVWCKLDGYPWWPSLVCTHPTKQSHMKKTGKVKQIHVQFFEKNPSRGWIKEKYVHLFKGSNDDSFKRGGPYFTLNTSIREGAANADKAVSMTLEERLALVVEFQPSSEEEDAEEEEEEVAEKMYFDPAIFDTEMSDDENAKNKKGDSPSEKKENDSPGKSPTKPQAKSKRKAARIADMKSKRRKIMKSESADESEDDFKPSENEDGDDDEDDSDSESSGVDEDDVTDHSASEPEVSPVKPIKRKAPPQKSNGSSTAKKALLLPDKPTGNSPTVSANTKSKLSLFSAPELPKESPDAECANFTHLKFDFIQPEKIRDKTRKAKNDPDYNPRTVYVPESFLNQQTPAMRQWWLLKSDHFDTVLFFKVGKFYELYHMDAVTGVSELGLIYMKGDWAHSGFPEIAYSRYADALLQKGYKVARVEQTETPDMMQERCRNMGRSASKYDKVVKREVCQVNSQGVRTSSSLEDVGDSSNYILAVCEKESTTEGSSIFGVCFIDTSIGTFHIGQFEDDRHLSRIRTLIAHYTPSQVLYERGKISSKVLTLINVSLVSAIKEALAPVTEFWESGKTLQRLSEEDYFKNEDKTDGTKTEWPAVLKEMLSQNDALGLTAAEPHVLAIRALGALTWYLQYCLIDHEMLSMKKFEVYSPLDQSHAQPVKRASSTFDVKQRYMVLDGVTMSNLDIARNGQTGSTEGSLLEKLNMCATAFGKRLFHQWICTPLCQPLGINDRLDAVDDLMGSKVVVDECVQLMRKLPDLERLLGRIHTIGSLHRGSKHPDARAIMYEEVTYSKRKIEDFLSTIEGFRSALTIIKKFTEVKDEFKSKVLHRSVTIQAGNDIENGRFPDIAEDLDFFDQAFDQKKAKKDGIIVPSKGVDEDYDEATSDIGSVQHRLGEYLDSQKKLLGCRDIVYWGTGKNRFQMEIPESAAKKIPNSYELMSSKKGAKRFRTTKIEGLLAELTDAEERKDSCLKDIMRRIFHSFDERHSKWLRVVECLSVLDVLVSLSVYSRGSDMTLCRPEIVSPEEGVDPMLEIREGRHPCVARTFEGGDFIPNDTLVGVRDEQDAEDASHSEGRMVLVTGPNMGGKSTLMRQVGLIVVMAQMGCYVPAEKCKLTPVDRIFTRLGASDRIMAGESTFFVELSETSSILQHATCHSLVLLDELGRGTATYDGTAIASSVVRELTDRIGCRTLFSTHYHSLVEDYKSNEKIQLGHMACMVENENEEDPSQETITFLYRFVKGACPKSYGFNAARLAGIVEEVIQSAVTKAKQFEEEMENKKKFRELWYGCSNDHNQLMSVLKQFKAIAT